MVFKNTFLVVGFLCCLLLHTRGQEKSGELSGTVPLEGIWTLALDPGHVGLQQNWQNRIFTEQVKLPGSLEENRKGKKVEKASGNYLNQSWAYIGAAWYQKEILIPESWKNKEVQLFLERTKATMVWLDGSFIGRSTLLSAPQVYQFKNKLRPGKHVLTIMVNNDPKLFSVGGSHALSEHTQTNWNGMIGKLFLSAAGPLKIAQVRVSPDARNKQVHVQVRISNLNRRSQKLTIQLEAKALKSKERYGIKPVEFKAVLQGADTLLSYSYPLGSGANLWDEYHPSLYQLKVSLSSHEVLADTMVTKFGLRDFKAAGTQFKINDVITFLRGKNDGCIFPLTEYPPMEVAAWRKLYQTARSYGINHYRFHSYTPPDAAFEAADLEGIYIQTELPNWANFSVQDTFHTNFQYREAKAILDAYGNHPSFVLFSLGNELGGDSAVHNKLVRDLKSYDARPLYAYGTNAFYLDPKPGTGDDFWVTMRTGKESSNGTWDVRGSFATTEDVGNGIINSARPSSRRNFSAALKGIRLPVIGHETGQYQLYPDYTEMPKYTGILRPLNFEIFKQRLEDAGMAEQAGEFFKASGMLSALLYREEIEMAFRTPGFAGFQLLELQDYPGQGTALVGLLNAFMENKGLISAAAFRRFNNDVTLQLLMDKYTWTNEETFVADVQLINYSPHAITGRRINWTITSTDKGRQLASGSLAVRSAKAGQIHLAGKISFRLGQLVKAQKVTVKLSIPNTKFQIEYPIWVYPKKVDLTPPNGVIVVSNLGEEVIARLNEGTSVLLFPDHTAIENKSVGPQFIAEFWNWLVFKKAAINMKRPVSAGTLGILTRPDHPLFMAFPTDFYTNWQWWSILKHARPLILDSTNRNYRPIVQVIDNIDRNHKLGMVFEFKIGKGKLLVSMANLPAILDQPEARQLYHSMLAYISSDKFDPQEQISLKQLEQLL